MEGFNSFEEYRWKKIRWRGRFLKGEEINEKNWEVFRYYCEDRDYKIRKERDRKGKDLRRYGKEMVKSNKDFSEW